MNVLADRHHGGLFRSLQLLADRMGWTLYAPTGLEWWENWYWNFGRSTYADDRLGRQFLLQEGPDPEFPNVPISYVTLQDALNMDWDVVIASVPDNEDGFSRFARLKGARYVVQVGNTGQPVDWSLDPVALISSETRLQGEGVIYHQEMEPIEFLYPPVLPHSAASFVNCMPQMGYCWDLLEKARENLHVLVHGINGPNGIVKPFKTLVGRMHEVGWGWHDKAQGDGFGHVIHSWAAAGRPIIGHASHYAEKLAERFWQDGKTCIDLDRHSVRDAVDIVKTISREEHQAMCRAIRAEFEAIDYDAEAESIRELLAKVPA